MFSNYKNKKIAVYGLSTETERFIMEHGHEYSIVGLLDGFKEDGEMYGYPIIPLTQTVNLGVSLIIVVARPGSCKAITKRIGAFCKENNIALFDVRGKDLLAASSVRFDFSNLTGVNRQYIEEKISKADVVSFDLFDTLITRRVLTYTNLFDILDLRLRKEEIFIPDFSKLRLQAEKALSKDSAPTLEKIYSFVLDESNVSSVTAKDLAQMEYKLDVSTLCTRDDVCQLLKAAVAEGKKVVVTTDSYYSKEQIQGILNQFAIVGLDDLWVSCEYGVAKTQTLFELLKEKYNGLSILHIGNDTFADIEKATEYGLETCHLYSGQDLFDSMGGLGLEDSISTLADEIKVGMFIANVFNSPFWFEEEAQRVSVADANQIGYLFCAPMITDFILWMKKNADEENCEQLLFGARDGYLPIKLYEKVDKACKSVYFLTSRTAAIRAGMMDASDIEYVDSMKYSGTVEEATERRFGIVLENDNMAEREKLILDKARMQRDYYKGYIEQFGFSDRFIGMFDFVAKGTTQMYLEKLFHQHIKGYYFLQLEPEFMADKGLDIEPFYSHDEKDESAIFENYYILETILTAPYPQVKEFNGNGEPVFAEETRSVADLNVFEMAQNGITRYFDEYLALVPAEERYENKSLDEKLLALINNVLIKDNDFLNIQVEDPFFGRMTDIRDVIG